MTKKIDIAGEINAATVDGIVADAKQVRYEYNVPRYENKKNAMKILCLGDSITEKTDTNGKSYPDYISEILNCTTINGGIGGSGIPIRGGTIFEDEPVNTLQAYAPLDLAYIVQCLVTGDWAKVDIAVKWINENIGNDDNSAIIARLKSVDLSEIGVVTIFSGTNNCNSYTYGEVGGTDPKTISGGFYTIVHSLLTAYPHLRIYYFTPMVRYFGDLTATWDDSQWSDNYIGERENKSFPEFIDFLISLSKYYHIPVCDMYWTLGINQWNIKSIMSEGSSDGTHPTRGLRMIAQKMSSFILANNNINKVSTFYL